MSEHRYTIGERRAHLLDLELALQRLLAAIQETGRCVEYVPGFESALSHTRELMAVGFDQAALTALSQAIPKLFFLHPHWVPPTEIGPNGQQRVVPWFTTLEPLDQGVTRCGERLRFIGFY